MECVVLWLCCFKPLSIDASIVIPTERISQNAIRNLPMIRATIQRLGNAETLERGGYTHKHLGGGDVRHKIPPFSPKIFTFAC